MGKHTHTPGPWRIDVNGSENWSVDYDGPSSTYMTICGDRKEPVAFAVEPSAYGNDDEVEANARLIAAAPDHHAAAVEIDHLMLVIESAVRTADPLNYEATLSALKANRAAIRRAQGEGSE